MTLHSAIVPTLPAAPRVRPAPPRRRRMRRRTAAAGLSAASVTLLSLVLLFGEVAAAGAARAQEPAPVAPPAVTLPPAAVTLPAGTRVRVRLKEPPRLRSGDAKVGDAVRFVLAGEVSGGATGADGKPVLIPAGAELVGTVLESRGAGAFGRAGSLRLSCERLLLPDGTYVPVRLAGGEQGDGAAAPDAAAVAGASGRGRRFAAGTTGVLTGLFAALVVSFATADWEFGNGFGYPFGDGGGGGSSSNTASNIGSALVGVGAGYLAASLWRGGVVTLTAGGADEYTLVIAGQQDAALVPAPTGSSAARPLRALPPSANPGPQWEWGWGAGLLPPAPASAIGESRGAAAPLPAVGAPRGASPSAGPGLTLSLRLRY